MFYCFKKHFCFLVICFISAVCILCTTQASQITLVGESTLNADLNQPQTPVDKQYHTFNIEISDDKKCNKYSVKTTANCVKSQWEYFILSCMDYIYYQTSLVFFNYNLNLYKRLYIYLYFGTSCGGILLNTQLFNLKYCKITFLDIKYNILASCMYYLAYRKHYWAYVKNNEKNKKKFILQIIGNACSLHLASFLVYNAIIKIDFLCLFKLYRFYTVTKKKIILTDTLDSKGIEVSSKDFSILYKGIDYISLAQNCFIPKKPEANDDYRFLLNVLIPDISIDLFNMIKYLYH